LGDFILTLHTYNVYLVILAGAITGIWGLIIFFRTKSIDPDRSKPATKDAVAGSESKPTTNEVVPGSESKPATNEIVPDSVSSFATEFSARTKPWRRMLTITVVLSLLQGVFGIIMVIMGKKPGPPGADLYYLHFVYGGIVALVIPIATTYATGGKKPRRDLLVYSLAALILTAAAVRAWMTGPAVFSLLP
jgi:heme A synthase